MKEYNKFFFSNLKQMFIDLKDPEKRKKQIPNFLTLSRALAPILIIPSVLTGNLPLAFAFTGCFAITDALDGYYARKYDATSDFGKELDPIVDKIFAGSLIIPLVFTNPIFIVNLLGELGIATVNAVNKAKGCTNKSSIVGKVKTIFLSCLIASAYATMAFGWSPTIMLTLFGTTTLLQTTAIIDYSEKFKRQLEKLEKIEIINFDIDQEIEKEKQDEREKELYKTLEKPHNLISHNEEEIAKKLVKEK